MDSRGGGGAMEFSKNYFRSPKLRSIYIGLLKNFKKKLPLHINSIVSPPPPPPRINRVFPLMIPFVVHIQIQDMKPNLIYNSILIKIKMVNNYAKVRQAVIKQGTLSDCCTRLLQKLISPKLQFLPLCDEFIS